MAEEIKLDTDQPDKGFLLAHRTRIVKICRSVQQIMHRIFQIVLIMLEPLVIFFSFIGETVRYIYTSKQKCVVLVHAMVHFDYKSFTESLLEMPKTIYHRSKAEARERFWKPVDRTLRFLARHLWVRLQTLKIYCRGLAELSRRLFLLTSDYTPGGKWTVGILLGVLTFLLVTRLLTYMGTFLQLVKFLFNIALFILDPIILTLKDILAAMSYMLTFLLVFLRSIFSIFCSALKKTLYFIGINLSAISTGVYNCWRSLLTSKPVQLLCTLSLSLVYNSLDIVVFSVVPVLSRVLLYGSTYTIQVSTFAYSKLAVVSVQSYTGDWYYSVTNLTTAILLFYALWTTFRLRNTFPPALYAMVDGYESIKSSKIATEGVSSKKASPVDTATQRMSNKAGGKATSKTEEDKMGVYIRTSSLDPICSSFLLGNCQRGRLCDGHHCHAMYHWQYRSMRGWKSFRDEENHVIERLYCDPNNDVVKTSDVKVVLTSYISRHATPADELVKLDFENMKVGKNYRTADLRRLSTQSYVKASDITMATRWVWYHQDDEMVWRKYGNDDPNENVRVKQEDIEEAFVQRERYYNFSRNGKDFRLYFFMKPMCERSVNYRDNSKRGIRRRPEEVTQEKPAEQQEENEKTDLTFWQKWSPLRVISWR